MNLKTGLAFALLMLFAPLLQAQDCFWVGPYTWKRPETNVALPDAAATYWSARFKIPAGAQLLLRGDFAHARYQSFTAYNSRGEPSDALPDLRILPDPGSSNPFLPGADRKAERRAYTLTVIAGEPPRERAPNTLYAKPGIGGQVALLYRVYVPDDGRDDTGGSGLPRASLRDAGGRSIDAAETCAKTEAERQLLDSADQHDDSDGLLARWREKHERTPAKDPPVWHAFYSGSQFVLCNFLGRCEQDKPERVGGLYSNPDNQYLNLLIHRGYGPLVVLQGQLPQTPRTADGNATMQPAQLRYWSLCSGELFTQKVHSCLYDEQLPFDAQRRYTIVVAHAQDRPANARAECGVGFVEWSAEGNGNGAIDDGLLMLRNMLPAPEFQQAVQNTRSPGDEAAVMGPYLPQTRYSSREQFEALGCNRAAVSKS